MAKKTATTEKPESTSKARKSAGKAAQTKGSAKQSSVKDKEKSTRASSASKGKNGREKVASARGGANADNGRKPRATAAEEAADASKQASGRSNSGKADASASAALRSHTNGNGHDPGDDPRERDEFGHLVDSELKKIKAGLKKKQLTELRATMLEKRAELIGDVSSLDAARQVGSGGDLSHVPQHMADVGSDAYEQEFSLGLMASERKLLAEIDAALLRLHRGTYGICLISGEPIPPARLEAKPWAKYCIEVVRQREKMGLE